MRRNIKKSNIKEAFTIVELLTVMSIIVILMGLLVPAFNRVRIYAKGVNQRAQLRSIDVAIELFSNEFDGYPPSSTMDSADPPQLYCGAMKLCEAMLGQDMLGFHTNSVYMQNGTVDGIDPPTPANMLYGLDRSLNEEAYKNNLKARKGPFLPAESANVFRMVDIYDDVNPFDPCDFVLCDTYTRRMLTGKKTGMPILYYKANTANNVHYYESDIPTIIPPASPNDDSGNIYNYFDNFYLIEMGKPWVEGAYNLPAKQHNLYDDSKPDRFYEVTKNHKITTAVRPYKDDTYILLSAGYDGEYGTADDIFNFDWKYRE